jgi:uncharacterized membrane protein
MSLTHVQEHIDLIARHEQEYLAQRTSAERAGDAIANFAGSFPFVFAHLSFFIFWFLWNTSRHTRHFDPAPFSMLGTLVGVEAILLASFILMRQARIGRRNDLRDHLILQVLLLTEKEVTAVLSVGRQIAQQVGIDRLENQADVSDLSRKTSIEEVAQTIKEVITDENSTDLKLDGTDPFRELL